MSEFLPFLRCDAKPGSLSPGYTITFKLADGTVAVANVNKDRIHEHRLCKVSLRKFGRNTAIVILPAPVLGKGCAVEVPKNLLEWHR